MRYSTLIIALISTVAITACNEDKTTSAPPEIETTHDVAYYKANPNERAALLKKCKNDPAKYALNGNCLNAEKAQNSSVFSSKKGVGQIKPLTAAEMSSSK